MLRLSANNALFSLSAMPGLDCSIEPQCGHSFSIPFIDGLHRCFNDGTREYDLLFGDEPFKFTFTDEVHRLFAEAAFRNNPRGQLARLWFTRLRPSLRGSALQPALRRLRCHGLLRKLT